MSESILKKLSSSPTAGERRVSQRFHVNLEIMLLNQKSLFRSWTQNLSLTGALLKEPAPKTFLRGPIDVMLIAYHPKTKQKTYFNFKALMVGGPESSPRLTFLNDKDQSFERLKDFFGALGNFAA